MGLCHGLEVSHSPQHAHFLLLIIYSYCLQWLFILPIEIIAGAFTIGYWNEDLSKSIFVAIFLLAIVIINLFGVKTYGEAEYIFSLIKITAIVGFMYVIPSVINLNTNSPASSPS
jgi:amino acid transporter